MIVLRRKLIGEILLNEKDDAQGTLRIRRAGHLDDAPDSHAGSVVS